MKLKSSRGRKQQNRFPIYGIREILTAIRSAVQIQELFVCREQVDDRNWQVITQYLNGQSCELFETSAAIVAKLGYGDREDGVVAIAERPDAALSGIRMSRCPLVCVVEAIEKPGNVGAVLRCCDAAGVDAVLLADPVCDPFHPNAIRASLGCCFSVPIGLGTSRQCADWLNQHGVSVFPARPQAEQVYTHIDFSVPAAVVFGSESSGLSSVWSRRDFCPIQIPMHGQADSLNISATAAVILFEARRQRAQEIRLD